MLLFVSRSIGIRWCHGQELACGARNHVSTSRILDLQSKKTIDSFETFFSSSLKYGQQRMANSVWPTAIWPTWIIKYIVVLIKCITNERVTHIQLVTNARLKDCTRGE